MLQWDEKLSLGVASIDEEHKYLVSLANAVIRAAKEGKGGKPLVEFMRRLREYTVSHFHNEEQFMAEIGYPELAAHRQQHEELRRRVREYQDMLYRKNDVTAEEILDFMKHWLVDHVIYMDLNIAKFLKTKNAAVLDADGEALPEEATPPS